MRSIRRANDDDLPDIIALRSESEKWLAEQGIEQWTSKWDEVGRRKLRDSVQRREAWVVEDEGQTIATVTLNTRPDLDFWRPEVDGPALYLYKMLVARKRSGEGVGAEILDWATDRAAKDGFPYLRLDVWRTNHALQRYYLANGFEHVRTEVVPGRDSGACFQRRAVRISNLKLREESQG
ncbi:GNAT family N-acetyltransferase [Actinomadura citrea]|uniref:GNAT family N-acetyltransferase n=1 Tax=Actinomadura citrea TaxID=46158 RepID=UPI003CE4FFE6